MGDLLINYDCIELHFVSYYYIIIIIDQICTIGRSYYIIVLYKK